MTSHTRQPMEIQASRFELRVLVSLFEVDTATGRDDAMDGDDDADEADDDGGGDDVVDDGVHNGCIPCRCCHRHTNHLRRDPERQSHFPI